MVADEPDWPKPAMGSQLGGLQCSSGLGRDDRSWSGGRAPSGPLALTGRGRALGA